MLLLRFVEVGFFEKALDGVDVFFANGAVIAEYTCSCNYEQKKIRVIQ